MYPNILHGKKGTSNSSLFDIKKGKKRTYQIKHEQVIIDLSSDKGYLRGTVRRVQSNDMGKTYVGIFNKRKVVRTGHANGFMTKRNETAGKWKFVV